MEGVRDELPIDEARVAAYARIIEAQNRIAASRTRAGVTDAEIDAALDACEPRTRGRSVRGTFISRATESFVAALGGRLDGMCGRLRRREGRAARSRVAPAVRFADRARRPQ